MIGEQCIAKNIERSGHDLVQEPSRNFPGRRRKANEGHIQDSRCLRRVSKLKPSDYKLRALSLEQSARLLRPANFSLQEFGLNVGRPIHVTYNSRVPI